MRTGHTEVERDQLKNFNPFRKVEFAFFCAKIGMFRDALLRVSSGRLSREGIRVV
jgi:hypothetical protein